jgi:hypothetical protein
MQPTNTIQYNDVQQDQRTGRAVRRRELHQNHGTLEVEDAPDSQTLMDSLIKPIKVPLQFD